MLSSFQQYTRDCLLLICLLLLASIAQADSLTCSGTSLTSLTAFVDCAINTSRLGAEGSGEFIVPNDSDLSAWKSLFSGVLSASSSSMCLSLDPTGTNTALDGIYEVLVIADQYCVAYDVLDENSNGVVDHGWDLIISPFHPLRQSLHIQAPHTFSDSLTSDEGAVLMMGLDAASLQISGARRDVSDELSDCDSNFMIADAAHNVDIFHFASSEILADIDDVSVFQLHGMGTSSCLGVDAFPTFGSTSLSDDDWNANPAIRVFSESLIDQGWAVTVPGGHLPGSCNLAGTTNPGGRRLNGVPSSSVCTTSSNGSYTQKFIHLEQKRTLREEPEDVLTAMLAAFPEDPSPSLSSSPSPSRSGSESVSTFALGSPSPSISLSQSRSQTSVPSETASGSRSVGSSASSRESDAPSGPIVISAAPSQSQSFSVTRNLDTSGAVSSSETVSSQASSSVSSISTTESDDARGSSASSNSSDSCDSCDSCDSVSSDSSSSSQSFNLGTDSQSGRERDSEESTNDGSKPATLSLLSGIAAAVWM